MNAADLVFGVSLLLGGGLLLLTLIVDDIFGGLLGAIHLGFDVAGVSPTPMLLGFIAMFGVGGLFGLHGLNAGPGVATLTGVVAGLLGSGVVFGAFKALRSAESTETFSLQDMVGSRRRDPCGPGGEGGFCRRNQPRSSSHHSDQRRSQIRCLVS